MLGLVVALAASSSGVGATAEPPTPEQARRLSAEGLAAFREQRYAEAIAKFEASYQLAPMPLLIFDIAQAYRLQGDCAHALAFYRRYQREATVADDRAAVEAHLAELQGCAEAPPATGEPAAAATPANPQAPALAPAAPARTATVAAPATAATVAPAGGEPAAPRPRRRTPLLLLAAGGGTAAAGLGALAVAIYFTVDSARAATSIAKSVQGDGQWRNAPEQQTDARGRRDDAIAAALYAVGGAAVAGGGALFTLGRTRARARATHLSLLPLVGGGMFACAGTF